MRYVCSVAAIAVVLSLLGPSVVYAQGAPSDLSITNYQFVSDERLTRTQWYVTYRADLMNYGPARSGVTATVTSVAPSIVVVPGQGTVHFASVPANGRAISTDTFTLLVDRSVTADLTNLRWAFLNPVANAGANQTAPVGGTVALNGSGSTNPSGVGTLTYRWAFTSRPASSAAALSNPNAVMASFVVDVPGTYVITLTVSNGAASDSASVTVSTVNSPPVAKPGPNQTTTVGGTVALSGSASSDVDGDPLTYLWGFVSRPPGSTAEIANSRMVSTTFTADKAGTYIVQLVVNDGKVDSAAATVTITTTNTAPVANAGANQKVDIGSLVQINGAGSTDVDGDTLTYKWSLITVPTGSTAALSNVSVVNPVFTADRQGTYVAQLIVNDGKVDSAAAIVTITTNEPQAPVANAGPNQTVSHGATVTLHGTATDPQGLPLTLTWSLITRPPGSTAALSSTTVPSPTFIADKPGSYVAQLMASNGTLHSSPSNVTITTTNTAPVADAGSNQNVTVGTRVYLDGGSSTDADSDPLTYSWSFMNIPPASTTALQAPSGRTPSFIADVPGTYIVQLIVNDGYTNSNPSTVTITASTMSISLTPNPLNLFNAPVTLTVTLSAPAGTGGKVVTFSGYDPNVISLPPSVTVQENSTGANVKVTPLAAGNTNLLAMAPGYQPCSIPVKVTTPVITVGLSLTAVGLGRGINGTVTLSAPAPEGGTNISFSSTPAGLVTFDPPTLAIPAGDTAGTFKVTGAAEGSATVTASANGYISGTAGILVVKLGGIILPANARVAPGKSAPLDVKLAMPAPVDGVTITLSSGNTSILTVSQSTFIPQGATSPSTAPVITGVTYGSAIVTASASGFTGDSQTVTVGAALSFSPQAVSVGAGKVQSIDLLLSAPAPAGGLPITLTSSDTAIATVPGSATIPDGGTTFSVPVTAVAAGSATITATTTVPNITSATATVTVVVFGSVSLPANVSVGIGRSAPFPVTLSAAAPQGGVAVTLATSDATKVDISPKNVSIAAGQTQPATQPQVTGVGFGTATITATVPGFGSASQAVQTTSSLSFSQPNLTITGTQAQNLTINLSGNAPAGGLTVNLAANPPGIVNIPASVSIAQNANTATIVITPLTPGNTVITASTTTPGIASATANITVQSAGTIILPSNVTLALGQSAAFPVSLSTVAPQGGVTVALNSSDTSKITISPSTVTIAAGQSSPATAPQITGVNLGSANITATAPVYTSASQAVQVTASLSFSPQTLTLSGKETKNLTLTLSGPAPAGGLTFNVSSSNTAAATVTSTVVMQANSTTVAVPVTGVAPGSAVIRASAPNLTEATANVTVTAPLDIIVPATLTVSPGNSVAFPVSLAAPAQSGISLMVSSSDETKATVSPSSVSISAGDTQPRTGVRVYGVAAGTATITVKSPLGNLNQATSTVTVGYTITLAPANQTVRIDTPGTLALTLSAPAPAGGMNFTVVSSNTAVATVPSSVSLSESSTSLGIRVMGVAAGTAVIRVSAPGVPEVSANVTVPAPGSVTMTGPASMGLSETAALNISLSTPAAGNGASIDLISSDPSRVSISPTTITIPAGATVPQAQPQIFAANVGSASISVSAPGYTLPTPLVVQVHAGLTWLSQNVTITGYGVEQFLTLKLSAMAPQAPGLTVNLSSSNPAVATIQATGTFIWDGSTSPAIVIPVHSVGPGTTTIKAVGTNIPEASTTVTVVGPLAITTAVLPNGQAGTAYALTAAAGGGTAPLHWSATGLPANLTINASTGQISGTPAAAGTSNVTLSVTDSGTPVQTVTKTLPLTITAAALTITTASLTNGQAGTAYTMPMAVAGGTAPLHWSATGLPANLTMDASTGQISGMPAAAGTSSVAVTVTDSGSPVQTANKTLSLTIAPAGLAITTASLANGQAGTAYNVTLAASGGTGALHWSATGLPASLTINASTGQITGTPGAAGTSSVAVTVTDSGSPVQTANKTFSLTIAPATLTITTASLAGGQVGTAYSATLAASGGTGAMHWSATGLPANLAINASTGQITGTPGAAGTSSVGITVTDSGSPVQTATKTLSLTIAPATLTITTASLLDGQVGANYSGAMSVSGGTGAMHWSATGLPASLTINASTGQIAGMPAATGTSSVNFTVTDSGSPVQTATKTLSLVITPARLAITTSALTNGQAGVGYSLTMSASGGTGTLHWAATGLPANLTISAAGVISGTPASAGTSSVGFTVTDSANPVQSATRTLSLTITPATLTITTGSLANGQAGVAYTAAMAASGGTGAMHWSATGLPANLAINASTGQITGTPSAAGTSNVAFTLTDSGTPVQTATKTLSLTIAPATLTITTASLTNGQAGTAYSATMAASGGTGAMHWSATGLPANLAINASTGQITGTPSAAGTSSVAFTLTDSGSPVQTATKTLSLTIAPATLTITTASLANGQAGTSYTAAMAASGGTGAMHWSATGLPANLTINASTGQITGTPSAAGTSSVAFTVTDSGSPVQTATKTLSLTIAPATLTISTASLANGQASIAYTAAMAATGGTAPLHWSATGLPANLTINTSTGQITGTPSAAGTSSVAFTVTDSGNPVQTGTKTLSLVIAPPPPTITTASLPNGQAGTAYNLTVTASGGTLPLHWSATGLPANLTINATTGQITGTPAAAGTSSVTLTVTDSASPVQTGTKTLSLVIVPPPPTITTAALPNGQAGTAYNLTVTASGGTVPLHWSATGLPANLAIDANTGQITGTPAAAGTSSVTLTVTDSASPVRSANATLSLVIAPAPLTITTTSLPNAQAGTSYSATVTATGGTAPLHWSATGLPANFSINPNTGQITGNPTAGGTASVTVTVSDTGLPVQTTNKTLSLTITQLNITTSALPSGQVNVNYTAQLAAAGGVNPLAWSSPNLPRGLSLDPSTGSISGQPTYPGTTQLIINVTDSSSPAQNASRTLALVIGSTALTIVTTSPLPGGATGSGYSAQLNATGGTPTYSWSATGLPNGLTINSATGTIVGMPAVVGTATVVVTVTDSTTPTAQHVSKTFALTVTAGVGVPVITVSNASVGNNLQKPITITFTPPPTNTITLTITSSDPALVKLGSSGVAGDDYLQADISAGTPSVSTFVKALAASGSITITASAPGYTNGTGTVTLGNAGFVVAGPNGIGSSFTTYQGVVTQLTVYAGLLDSSGIFFERQPIRGGYAVNVPISSSDTTVGTLSALSIPFSGGMDSATVNFTASGSNSGNTSVNLATPLPFTVPAAGSSLQATVQQSGLIPFQATIGKNLQTVASVSITGVATSDVIVTVHSKDAARLKFSNTPNGAASDTITVKIPVNQHVSADFYAHAYDSSGSVGYSASAPVYGTVDSTVALAPSGLVIKTPTGMGTDFVMSTGTANATLEVFTARLSGGIPVETQAVANGISVSVGVASNATTVGTITASPITISNAAASATTEFHAVGTGTATITADSAGYTSATVHASVQSASIGGLYPVTVGQFLQEQGSVLLTVAAPSGGVVVRLQSNSSLLKLAASATAAGSDHIDLTIPAGQQAATYYMQALGNTGPATFTATAPGYAQASATVTMVPSGIVIQGLTFVPLGAGPQPVTVYTTQLNSGGAPQAPQALAGGQSLTVTLNNSNPAAGTVPTTATVAAGASSGVVMFTPVASGQTTVSVVQPTGWTTPTSMTQLGITVQ